MAHFGLHLALSSPWLSQHGVQVALFKPSRPQQDLQATALQAFSRLLAPRFRPKNIDFPMVFKGFCNPTSQPHLMPTTILLNPRFAARCLPGPPRRAKEGPRQPKMGPRWAQQGAQDPPGGPDPPPLGFSQSVSWPFAAHLGAILFRWQRKQQQARHQRTNSPMHKHSGLVRRNARSD